MAFMMLSILIVIDKCILFIQSFIVIDFSLIWQDVWQVDEALQTFYAVEVVFAISIIQLIRLISIE